MTGPGLTYQAAGVDLDAAERAKRSLGPILAATRDANTLSRPGAFGGAYAVPPGMEAPVLVASADGVGTKLQAAFASGRHDTVGRDLVNHCVNDVLVQGARPLFFLDYLATGKMDGEVVSQIVSGVARACRENRCALLGGETAEMPGFYAPGEYDLAGFVVGAAERARLIDGARVAPGDRLVALPSTGLHTNGYTLARKIVFERMRLRPDEPFPGEDATVADVLLRVHRSYLNPVEPLLDGGQIKAMAHVTGGGIEGNLPRALPEGTGARIDCRSWQVPNVFRRLAEGGGVEAREMFRVFNMGVGLILVASPEAADDVLAELDDGAWALGEVTDVPGVRLDGVGHDEAEPARPDPPVTIDGDAGSQGVGRDQAEPARPDPEKAP